MRDTLANKLLSFETTLGVADRTEFKTVWQDQDPLAFTDELAEARTAVT